MHIITILGFREHSVPSDKIDSIPQIICREVTSILVYIVKFATILFEDNTTPRIPGKPGNEPKIDYFLMNARRARYKLEAAVRIRV